MNSNAGVFLSLNLIQFGFMANRQSRSYNENRMKREKKHRLTYIIYNADYISITFFGVNFDFFFILTDFK